MLQKRWSVLAVLVITGLIVTACGTGGASDEDVAALEAELAAAMASGDASADEIADLEAELAAAMESAAETDEEAAPAGGQIVAFEAGIFADPLTINYWSYLGPDSSVWTQYILDPYVGSPYTLSDQRFDFVPSLAADMPGERTQEGDFWTIEFKLLDGLTWSDGEALTADDIVFTVTVATTLELGGNWSAVYPADLIDHVEALDETTVKYYFNSNPGLAQWEFNIAQGPILPEHYWAPVVAASAAEAGLSSLADVQVPGEDASEEEITAYQELLVGASVALYAHDASDSPVFGPMTFGQWEEGAFVESPARGDYPATGALISQYANGAYQEVRPDGSEVVVYGDASGDVLLELETGPFVPSFIHNIYGTQDAAVLALEDGEIDYLFNPLGVSSGLEARIRAIPDVNITQNASNGLFYLAFNTRLDPMGDPAFRQAVATVIDKDFVTKTILQEQIITLETVVPEGNAFWHNPDVPVWGAECGTGAESRACRVDIAVALLQDAGYTWTSGEVPTFNEDLLKVDHGTLILPNGQVMQPIELLAPAAGYDPMRSTFAIWIEQWANDLGIPVTANLVGFNVILDPVFVESSFDWYILGWGLTIYPDYLENFFASKHDTATTGDYNTPGYSNPEFDTIAEEFLASQDVQDAQVLAFQLQDILAVDVPYVTLFSRTAKDIWRSNIQFPYTEVLDGITGTGLGLPSFVQVYE